MSSSFIKRFLNFSKHLLVEKSNTNITLSEYALRFGVLTTVLTGHGIYAYSTEETEAIIVAKKYKMDRNGFTEFMIIDDKGRHFNVNNSLWYWKWNSIEDWHKIEKNKLMFIRYYGWRIPTFGLFPNVILSDTAKFLDSMSRAEFVRFEAEKLL